MYSFVFLYGPFFLFFSFSCFGIFRVYPFLSLPFLRCCLLESECFCRKASTFSREIFLSKVFLCFGMRCVCTCVYVCVCVYSYVYMWRMRFSRAITFYKLLCLAVPNGMGVEAGDALLDGGPQSLPAMRLWTFCNFRSSESRSRTGCFGGKIQNRLSTVTQTFARSFAQYQKDMRLHPARINLSMIATTVSRYDVYVRAGEISEAFVNSERLFLE